VAAIDDVILPMASVFRAALITTSSAAAAGGAAAARNSFAVSR